MEEKNKAVEAANKLKAEQEALQKLEEEKLENEKAEQQKLEEAKALAAKIAAEEAANKIPENYNDAMAFMLSKLESRPWIAYMDYEIEDKYPDLLPELQETEKVVKECFNDVPYTQENIFGDPNNQTFFKNFRFKIDRYLMLDNKECPVSFANVKKLSKLLIGAFKIEARFLYEELKVISTEDQDKLFNYIGELKEKLPYSRTAVKYYISAKENNKASTAQMRDDLAGQAAKVKSKIEAVISEQEVFFDRAKWLKWQFIVHEVIKIFSD